MRRMSDGTFIAEQPDMDGIYAIRIKNGEFYIVGWMDVAAIYNMQIVTNPEDCLLDLDCFSDIDSLNLSIATAIIDKKIDTKNSSSPYQEFLSHVRNYERNGTCGEDDHDIFLVTEKELYAIADALRDGDYVFVIENQTGVL